MDAGKRVIRKVISHAGKFDVHGSAPQDYRDRMMKAKKKNEDMKQTAKVPGSSDRKAGEKEKKHCHAFNFGKSSCRYGAKCRFLHEKGKNGGKEKLPGFTPQQEKLVSTLLSSAMKRTAAAIAKKSKKDKKKVKLSKKKEGSDNDDDDDVDYSTMLASCLMAPISNTIRRDFKPKGGMIVMTTNLHDVNKNCGIDSDAGISISTLRDDFAWIDESDEAKQSIESPAGINGGTSMIGGRGPMIVRATSGELLVDPDAVYLQGGEDQPNFRVMSTQRLKIHGVRCVGCFKNTDVDVLQDRTSKKTIVLSEEGPPGKKILVLDTIKCPKFQNKSEIKKIVDDIRKRNKSAMIQSDEIDSGSQVAMSVSVGNALKECQDERITRLCDDI